jgi:hypothetical protein
MHPDIVILFTTSMLLSAAVCSIACFLLAARFTFSRSRRFGWALCGLAWGPVGFLLVLALQEWPARVTCHVCSKLRLVAHDSCVHCGARHATPAPDGTEIFEDP